jgi:hypothetical protein
MGVLEGGIKRLVGCCSDASFNVFVDYAPGLGDWVSTHCAISERLSVKVPRNSEVTTNFKRDLELMNDIPIQLLVLASYDIHLQV